MVVSMTCILYLVFQGGILFRVDSVFNTLYAVMQFLRLCRLLIHRLLAPVVTQQYGKIKQS